MAMMLFPPEPFRNVFGMAVAVTVETLVGGAGTQTAEFGLVAAYLHVIEDVGIAWQDVVAGVPCHLEFRVLAQMLG